MTPEVTDFIPVSLDDTDKYIEVADGHHVTAKALWGNVSKRSERKKRKLVLLVLHLTKIRIVQLGNALDADLKII